MSIATLDEFAYAIRRDSAAAAQHQLLLELAEGLAIDELGEQDEYSVSVKAVVLEAAARAYFNLLAAQHQNNEQPINRDAVQTLVYLTQEEIERLHGRVARGPRFSFPGYWSYPDPVEATPDTVSMGDVAG
jgi:hypothetical protein